jgi:hypothetical protein
MNMMLQNENNIKIEKEVTRQKGTNSIYFRDPVGNLVEIITLGSLPINNILSRNAKNNHNNASLVKSSQIKLCFHKFIIFLVWDVVEFIL